MKDRDLHTYGFLGYPILQCADIAIYSEEGLSLVVPVGEDQVSHVELSREIVRRMRRYWLSVNSSLFDSENKLRLWDAFAPINVGGSKLHPDDNVAMTPGYRAELTAHIRNHVMEVGYENYLAQCGSAKQFLIYREELREPQVMLTRTPRIPGLDGRKMSKSYGNTIMLSESDADIRAKTKVMVTDPARKRRTDPGNPDVCPVYDWHKLFSPPETLKWSAEGCRTAGIGCIECKAAMADNLIKWIAPVRERRVEYEKDPKRVLEVIDQGSQKARRIAQQTMTRVREAVFGWDKKRNEISGGGTAANA